MSRQHSKNSNFSFDESGDEGSEGYSGSDRGSSASDSSFGSYESEEQAKGYQYWVKDGALVRSTVFTVFINVIIIVNAVVIGLETDLACKKSSLACKSSDLVIWTLMEYFFLATFLLEAILKILHMTVRGYISDDWNKFDAFLLFFAVIDVWILSVIASSGESSLKIFSVLRVLRAFRLVRLVKLLRQFKELYLLVNGMVEAFRTLLWVGFLLLVILYVVGIMFTILIGQNTDEALRYKGQWTKSNYWGSVPRSMFTLFQVITGDSWGSQIAKPIVKKYPTYAIFFLLFIFLISFGLMNIVLGVICENAIYTAGRNVENMQKLVVKHQQLILNSITAIFEAADTDGSGELSKEEFDEAMAKKSVKQKLELIDVPPDDLRMLFDLLDNDGSGEITIEEFRKGCLKLQGTAKSREMIKLAVHVSTYNRNLDDMQDAMDEQNQMLRRIYNRLYDLEKQYFRTSHTRKRSKQITDEEDNSPPRVKKEGTQPISILGAVAAAGRHLARRRSSLPEEELNKDKYAPTRRSVQGITNFIRRNSFKGNGQNPEG